MIIQIIMTNITDNDESYNDDHDVYGLIMIRARIMIVMMTEKKW